MMNVFTTIVNDFVTSYIDNLEDREFYELARSLEMGNYHRQAFYADRVRSWTDDLVQEVEFIDTPYPLVKRYDGSLMDQLVSQAFRAVDWITVADSIRDLLEDRLTSDSDAVMYLLDGGRGAYLFSDLASIYGEALVDAGASPEDVEFVADPDNMGSGGYHDVVIELIDHYGLILSGEHYQVFSDDGIWAVRSDVAEFMPDGWPA